MINLQKIKIMLKYNYRGMVKNGDHWVYGPSTDGNRKSEATSHYKKGTAYFGVEL